MTTDVTTANEDLMTEQDEHALWRSIFGKRLDQLADQQELMQQRLEENTDATKRIDGSTQELVMLLNSWKGAMSVLETLGKVARPIGYIAAAAAAVWGFVHMFVTNGGSKGG